VYISNPLLIPTNLPTLYMFKTYYMKLPFSSFECGMLSAMNVALSHLHPNSWAFLKAFQIVCDFLHMKPTRK